MSNNFIVTDEIRFQDLVENPETRVPVCLCLDTSFSMREAKGGVRTGRYTTNENGQRVEFVTGGISRLDLVMKGVGQFYDAIYKSEDARYSAEIAVVTFDNEAQKISDFSRVEYDDRRVEVPELKANGMSTCLGAGVNQALDLLEERKKKYQDTGVDYYQPWLVIMTDGEDNGSRADLERAKKRIHKLVNEKKLCVYPFIIGTDEGMRTLKELSPLQTPMRIENTQMEGMFQWLGKSIEQVSSGSLERFSLNDFTVQSWDKPLG